LKPIFNLFLNNKFISQREGKEGDNETELQFVESSFPATYLEKGSNYLGLEITNYPRGDKVCGKNVLQLTFKDDSYIVFPKGQTEVEYPNLKYIGKMAFPFSIYPDLQNTGILITDFNANTIASAMQIAFQLGAKMESFGQYLTVTYDINQILEKDIIVLGNQIKQYDILYKNAPLKIIDGGILKEKDIKVDDKIVTVRKKDYHDFSNFVIAQTYQSPFNSQRIVFEILATTPKTLLEGTQVGLTVQNIGEFDGDVWLFDIKNEEAKSFRFKETYLINNIVDGYDSLYIDNKYQDISEF
jgi:hypothetical protein